MGQRDEERTLARDFTLARLAVCRGHLASSMAALDEALALFADPDEDAKGKDRKELLEGIDESLGGAATALQMAQVSWEDCDPAEGEPDPDDEDDDEDEQEDEDKDDKRRTRR